MINRFVLEPTDENLERHKRIKNGNIYWHTADFYKYDPKLEDELSEIFDAYMDAIMNDEGEDEDAELRRIGYSIGKMIVLTARRLKISPKDLRDWFDNFATVVWTPICVWKKDNSGKLSPSLMSGISGLKSSVTK